MEDFKFIGIDTELLRRIYFHSNGEREVYLHKIESALNSLSISRGDNRREIINKIADADIDLIFLTDLLAYSGDLQYSKNTSRNNYYTNCRLCEYNVVRKFDAGIKDFQEEESLFESVMQIDFRGYAKANLIYLMGQTFAKLNLWDKAASYFEIFRKTAFDISPATVSEFYRAIAEVYQEAGRTSISLEWLKDGLQINPKLPVKRLIKKLEAE